MLTMVRHHLARHKYKLAVGVPVVVLLASSLSLARSSEEVCLVPEDNRFVEVGETVTVQVLLNAQTPINVVAGTVVAPSDMVTVEGIDTTDSVVDLWTQEPTIEDGSSVSFEGGIISENGFEGSGIVLSLVVRPTQPGKAQFLLENPQLLAHDGQGTDVACSAHPITLSIRETDYPSPDINGDKRVTISDLGLVSLRVFRTYERQYDLNLDGKISMSDLAILFSSVVEDTRLGSLAVLW